MPILVDSPNNANLFRRQLAVNIANGQAVQQLWCDLGGGCFTLAGIHFPAAMTGTVVTFLVCPPEADPAVAGNYNDLYDDGGTEYEVTVTTGGYVPVDMQLFAGIRYFRIRSGTSGTPTAEAAARALVLSLRPV